MNRETYLWRCWDQPDLFPQWLQGVHLAQGTLRSQQCRATWPVRAQSPVFYSTKVFVIELHANFLLLDHALPSTCDLCFEEMQPVSMFRQLPCSHIFHKPCIDVWLVSKDGSCPICRETFYHLREPSRLKIEVTERRARNHHKSGKVWRLFLLWLKRGIIC